VYGHDRIFVYLRWRDAAHTPRDELVAALEQAGQPVIRISIDVPVPGRNYTFGVVKAAQARRDFQVLAERGRRVLRVHLGTDVAAGRQTLQSALLAAQKS
jgi:hypothetical protein